jgi:hypothetical protein
MTSKPTAAPSAPANELSTLLATYAPTDQICATLGICGRTLGVWHKEGLPAIIVGNRKLYKITDVVAFIENRRRSRAPRKARAEKR